MAGRSPPSWSEQWGNGYEDEVVNKMNNSSSSSSGRKMADVKAATAAGLGKAKSAAAVGAQKVKSGTSLGLKWVKNQCQKKSSSK